MYSLKNQKSEQELAGSQIQTKQGGYERSLSLEDQNDSSKRSTYEDQFPGHQEFGENQELLSESEKKNWFVLNIELTKKQQLVWMAFKWALGVVMLFLGAYLFLVKLQKTCPESEYEYKQQCVELLNSKINQWLKVFPIICLSLVGVTILGYYKFFDPYRIFMVLGLVENIVLCFCIYSLDLSKSDERNWASAQTLVLIVGLLLCTIIFFVIRGIVWVYYAKKFVFLVIVGVFAVFFGITLYATAVSCDGWEDGLDGSLYFDEPYCKINKPSICWPVVINGWLNLSPNTCSIKEKKYAETKKQALLYYGLIGENASESEIAEIRYIAWPKTNAFTEDERNFDTMQKSLMQKTIVVSSLEDAWSQGLEAAIDLDKLQMHINVQRDESIISAAQERAQQNPDLANGVADNVIVIYIDTLGRQQIHRKLPKSMSFLKKFLGDEQNKKFYEFYRFHAIDKYTLNNNMKLHYDYVYSQIGDNYDYMNAQAQTNLYPNLMHQFKQSGHILAHASNTCTSQCAFRDENQVYKHLFNNDSGDHEFLMYDPLYINPDNYFDSSRGPGSIKRRCVYNNDTNAFVFEYGYQFLNAYKDEKKVLYLEFTDSHELTSEVVQFVDEHLYNFFLNCESKGLLNEKTLLFIMADHGQHLVPAFYMAEKPVTSDMWEKAEAHPNKQYTQDVYKIERMLPVLQMLVSRDLLQENDDLDATLTENRQIVFGMGDLRNTFVTAVQGSGVQSGKYNYNLLNPLTETNDCRNIGMVPTLHEEQFCVCRPRFE